MDLPPVPTLPPPAAPRLPPPGAPTTAPAPTASSTAPSASMITPATTPTPMPPAPPGPGRVPSRRIGPLLVGATLAVSIGAVGVIGVGAWRSGPDTGGVPSAPTPADIAALPTESVPPLVGRVEDLVADIDGNSEEAIALDLLGVEPLAPFDSTGSISAADLVTGVVASSDVVGHSLRRELPDGSSVLAWVGSLGGDADVEIGGRRWRRSGGTWWSTAQSPTDPASAWSNGGAPPLDTIVTDALAVLPTADSLLPEAVRTFAGVDAADPGVWTIDDAGFAAAAPDARAAWLTSWGLDPAAAPGPLRVVMRTTPDGTVVDMSVTSTTTGASSRYTLRDVSTTPRTIPPPGS